MNRNLQHYSKLYKNFLTKDECIKCIEDQKNAKFKQHTFYNSKENTYTTRSGSQELDVSWDRLPSTKLIMDKLWIKIKEYQSELDFPWFNHWEGYTQIRYNKYSENRKMALHCDHLKSLFEGERKGIPTLSILGLLNDDFEGGDFVMWDDEVINFKQGDLLIFPSIFLYPHKVEPITKGTRYSYISWLW